MPRKVKKLLSQSETECAVEDRKRGYSYSEIVRKYGVSFRKAKEYLKGVDIAPKYRSEWLSKRGGSRKSAALRFKYIFEDVTKSYIKGAKPTRREKLFVLASLYWGEGAKRELSFANSDPSMVRLFTSLLLEVFSLPSSRISASIRIFEDMNPEVCRSYWSSLLRVPVYRVYVLKGKKRGKLTYGMCRIRLTKGTNILNTIKANTMCMSNFLAPIAQRDRAEDS